MTKEQQTYLDWLEDMLYQGGIMTQEEIEEAIQNLLKVFSLEEDIPKLEFTR